MQNKLLSDGDTPNSINKNKTDKHYNRKRISVVDISEMYICLTKIIMARTIYLQLLISLCALFVVSCHTNKVQLADIGENIGATITDPKPIDMATLVRKIETQDTVQTQLKAKVEGVCQVKGCWMNLVPIDGSSDESIFVKFTEYAFFMPLDLAGQNVIVEGKAYKEVTTVDELRHYAEDEGLSAAEIAKITEPVEELKFMADGVIILKK